MPMRRALKTVHGALYTDLTQVQKKRQEAMHYGISIPPTHQMQFEQQHPLLASVLQQIDGQPKGFPFWYKKYPTRRHAYENRFNIPTEMLDGYSDNIKRALSYEMMSNFEKAAA